MSRPLSFLMAAMIATAGASGVSAAPLSPAPGLAALSDASGIVQVHKKKMRGKHYRWAHNRYKPGYHTQSRHRRDGYGYYYYPYYSYSPYYGNKYHHGQPGFVYQFTYGGFGYGGW